MAGCAVAYELAKRGVGVTVVERYFPGAHASGYAAGLLNPLYGRGIPGPLQPLALEAYRRHPTLWAELKEETGVDVQGRTSSLLRLAFDDDDREELRALETAAVGVEGFTTDRLTSDQVLAMEPRLNSDVSEGLLIDGEASLDSYLYTLALSRAAQKHGVRFVRGNVVGLAASQWRVTEVHLADGSIPCDAVVLAMGPWVSQAERWLGLAIPVEPLKGEILRMLLPGPVADATMYHRDRYISWKPDGLVWCGTTEEDAGFDDRPSSRAREYILSGVTSIMPQLAEARVVGHTACLRPETVDGLPILGAAPGWQGVYLAAGEGHKGILLSPAIGKIICDLVISGDTQLPTASFDPARFAI